MVTNTPSLRTIEMIVIELDSSGSGAGRTYSVRQIEPKGQPKYPSVSVSSLEDAELTATHMARDALKNSYKVTITQTKPYTLAVKAVTK